MRGRRQLLQTRPKGRLVPGGQLLLYTGFAVVEGLDVFRAEMLPLLDDANCSWSYSKTNLNVFNAELEQPGGAHVGRTPLWG